MGPALEQASLISGSPALASSSWALQRLTKAWATSPAGSSASAASRSRNRSTRSRHIREWSAMLFAPGASSISSHASWVKYFFARPDTASRIKALTSSILNSAILCFMTGGQCSRSINAVGESVMDFRISGVGPTREFEPAFLQRLRRFAAGVGSSSASPSRYSWRHSGDGPCS